MKMLHKDTARKIINLKASDLIREAIAERQLEVIYKGFNYLSQPENNALYIADEVGLGKTYIALGIASLLRHFSDEVESYQDMILVPKENLQNKWAKEIRQFVSNNYLLTDNRVKSVTGYPVGSIDLHDSMQSVIRDVPGYHLFRNSSFSLGLSYTSPNSLKDYLFSRISSQREKDFLIRAERKGYFFATKRSLLKKFYAYLLSIQNAEIELLIVDEGHNFKHGLGETDTAEVSDRNNVTTRFFGIKRKSEEDEKIFHDFPEFRQLVKPKVKKLLVLSATPKTYSLKELKYQFDCFLPNHILSGVRSESEIESKLNQFLIRGKMEYELAGRNFSRNQCRFEHRKGNVDKHQDTEGLHIADNEQGLILGLIQYMTIRHLNQKHNATFEMGMLAGFETFKLDMEKRSATDQEFEEVRTKKVQQSQDREIVQKIIQSYRDKFGALPPHPKQDAMVQAIFEQIKKGEKSLVFVRRVASAYELERRLLDKWENEFIYPKLKQLNQGRYCSESLTACIQAYENYYTNRTLIENIEYLFDQIIQKLVGSPKEYPLVSDSETLYTSDQLKAALYYIYHHYKDLDQGELFYQYLVKQVHLEKFKREFIQCTYELILKTQSKWTKFLDNEEDEDLYDEEEEAYFFHQYFRQAGAKNFRKSRIYKTDWFDLNYYILNQYYQIADFEYSALTKEQIHTKATDDGDLREVQEIFLKYVKEDNYVIPSLDADQFPYLLTEKNTLITQLFLHICKDEFQSFLINMKRKGYRKSEIFKEIKLLSTIIRSTLRNGVGFLPLYIADNASGDFSKNYLDLIQDEESCFHHVINELKSIISQFSLLQAVNFPNKNNFREIENKLTFQTPVKGMSGIKKNKEKIASQFRMPGYPYVLVTTDIFREGEDLHTFCQNIYHYGIAWNSSDMEQRTGRIDRINSLSNRLMVQHQKNDFDQRIHVFYPYLQKTLEVNQVYRLFQNMNHFTRAFDKMEALQEDGMASVSDTIEQMPSVTDNYLRSKFDHDSFTGFMFKPQTYTVMPAIGMRHHDLAAILDHFISNLLKDSVFHLPPRLIKEDFKIIGDYDLTHRDNRRGPFRLIIKNSQYPGKFILELSAYLFKVGNRISKLLEMQLRQSDYTYQIHSIDSFYAIYLDIDIEGLDIFKAIHDLKQMVDLADTWEEMMTRGMDSIVFG
jgi:hypothetical protein